MPYFLAIFLNLGYNKWWRLVKFFIYVYFNYIFSRKTNIRHILQVFQSSMIFQPVNCQSNIHNETFFCCNIFDSFLKVLGFLHRECIKLVFRQDLEYKSRVRDLSFSLSIALALSLTHYLNILKFKIISGKMYF